MNKQLIPIFVVLVLIVLGGATFFITKKSSPPTNQTPTPTPENQNIAETIEGSIKSLLAAGRSIKCTFSDTNQDVTVEGTVYAAGGKVRQDFKSTSAQINSSGHIIVDSANSYMWMDDSNQGYKFPITDQAEASPSPTSQTADIDKTLKLSCGGWVADNSMFEVPTNINFQTLSLPGVSPAPAAAGTTNSPQCAACDSFPAGETRDACKAQLNCQ